MNHENQNQNKLLDRVGWIILQALQEDARISFSALGRRVGLTSSAVAERVRRMEEAGIIKGYRAEIDPAQVGLPMIVIMSIRSDANKSEAISKLADSSSEVLICHKVTGVECFYMRVAVRSVQHLEDVIERFNQHGQVTTSLVLSSPVPMRIISPSEGD